MRSDWIWWNKNSRWILYGVHANTFLGWNWVNKDKPHVSCPRVTDSVPVWYQTLQWEDGLSPGLWRGAFSLALVPWVGDARQSSGVGLACCAWCEQHQLFSGGKREVSFNKVSDVCTDGIWVFFTDHLLNSFFVLILLKLFLQGLQEQSHI